MADKRFVFKAPKEIAMLLARDNQHYYAVCTGNPALLVCTVISSFHYH